MTLEKVDISMRYHQAQIIIPGLEEQLSLIAPLDVTTELHSQDWETFKTCISLCGTKWQINHNWKAQDFFYFLFFLFLALGGSCELRLSKIAKRRDCHGLGPKMSHDQVRLNAVVDRSPINEGKYGDQMKPGFFWNGSVCDWLGGLSGDRQLLLGLGEGAKPTRDSTGTVGVASGVCLSNLLSCLICKVSTERAYFIGAGCFHSLVLFT